MTKPKITFALAITLSLLVLCAERSQAAPGEPALEAASVSQAFAAAEGKSKVTKVVFVGKARACDCTRKTIDAGWAALRKALGTPPKLPVVRLQVDTDRDKVEPYRTQKPMMDLPAIYFVDGKNVVVELLEGEVTAEQIRAALR
jgi:hypothetical protein